MSISAEEALKRLEKHALVPIGEYPGAASKPWVMTCLRCRAVVTETLQSIEKRSRPGCKKCCSISQNRIAPEEAERRLRSGALLALEPYPGTVNGKWRVRCSKCGWEHETSLATLQTRKKSGCSKCGLAEVREDNRVTEDEAFLRAKTHSLEPLENYPGHTKARWKCRCLICGNIVTPSLNQITTRNPCKFCGRMKSIESRRLSERDAVARLLKAGAKPTTPYPGASIPWPSICLVCEREISPTLMAAENQSACKYCSKLKRVARQLEESLPRAETQMKMSAFVPIGEYRGFTKPWHAKCLKCGLESSPSPKSLAAGHGCRWCASNASWTPKMAATVFRSAKRQPLQEFAGASVPIMMRCERCGNEAKGKPSLLLKSRGFCNRCKPTAEWSPEKALQFMRVADMEPLEPFKSATTPWKAKCLKCNTVGSPRVSNLASGQGGCKVCGNYGFDIQKPTTLYVLHNRTRKVIKVGITNTGSVRLRALAGAGFTPGKLYLFKEGLEPLRIETLLLRHFRKELGLSQALTNTDMRGAGGATETFWQSELKPSYIHFRIRALMSYEAEVQT